MKKPLTAQRFLKDVRAFCKKYKISPRDVGVRALNDTAFFGRLERGKSPTLLRVERVYDFMIAYETQAKLSKQFDSAEDV